MCYKMSVDLQHVKATDTMNSYSTIMKRSYLVITENFKMCGPYIDIEMHLP